MEQEKDLIEKITQVIIKVDVVRERRDGWDPYHLETERAYSNVLQCRRGDIFCNTKSFLIVKERYNLIFSQMLIG